MKNVSTRLSHSTEHEQQDSRGIGLWLMGFFVIFLGTSTSLFADTTITIMGRSSNPGSATVTVSGSSLGVSDSVANQDAARADLHLPDGPVDDTYWFVAPADTLDFVDSELNDQYVSIDAPFSWMINGVDAATTINAVFLDHDGTGIGPGDDFGLGISAVQNLGGDARTYSISGSSTFTFPNVSGFNSLVPGTYARQHFVFGDIWTLVIIDTDRYQTDNVVNGMGDDVYNGTGAGQTATLKSKRARTVAANLNIQNDGIEPDSFSLIGSPGNSFFKITYTAAAGNVTAAVTTGVHTTASLDPGGAEGVSVRIKPNRRKFKKVVRRRGRRTVKWKKKKKTISLTSTSQTVPASIDAAKIKVVHN